ncbi:FtsX-like permease family protein [Sanguibacter suaedae]|uniref:ABC transporter permease n=1 Tax=Sanguibacter suaedae TaxID=2795737 RepID=A0A934IBG7_9MICO|nr:ABC transporter permease [Sanguibacter suaedae]MBI9115625.1 ABC transporter permease [Sanguibacter suaedae]
MWSFARSSARAHRASLAGAFVIVVLASALLTATGVLLDSGARTGFGAEQPDGTAMLLVTVASSFAGTTVLVVLLMVSTTISAALRQRRQEFALLRAVGATGGQVRQMVTGEVLLVLALAGPVGAVPGLFAARLLTPLLESGGIVPAGYQLTLSPWPVLGTLLLLVPTGLLAARLASKEAVRTSPTAAVQQSEAEPSALSTARRTTAACLGVAGVAVATVPFFSPGIMGTAAAASSALLLITGSALAGPLLVAGLAERAVRASGPGSSVSGHMAMLNARGFSRRLTAAIVPLALLLALGTVQSGVDRTVVEASGVQLEDGLTADLVVDATDTQSTQLRGVPGVDAVASTGTVTADVKIEPDDEDLPALDALSWEPTALRLLGDGVTGVVDPLVREGTLDDLASAGTVAVSQDATFGTSKGLGDTVEVRDADGVETELTIVAVYDRSLGFGDYMVGLGSGLADGAALDTALVRTDAGATGDVRETVEALGLGVRTTGEYVDEVRASGAEQQQFSAVLLLALLTFIAMAAANTLAMLSSQRGGELALLRRTGATGRQLTTMVAVEAAFVAVLAWGIGTLSVVPALVGAGYGLLGTVLPPMNWPMYGGLTAAVVLIAVLAIVPVAARRGAGMARA